MKKKRAALSLGPVYYLWDGPKWRDFYFRIADEAPVEHVTLGETVCSKRQHFSEPHVAEVVSSLKKALAATPAERAVLVSRLRAMSEGQRTTAGAYDKRWR